MNYNALKKLPGGGYLPLTQPGIRYRERGEPNPVLRHRAGQLGRF